MEKTLPFYKKLVLEEQNYRKLFIFQHDILLKESLG